MRMISEVPLGAFLSGGVDSSTVVALMAEESSQPVETFSIGFEEQDYSELKYARRVEEHVGAEYNEFIVKPNAIDILPTLVEHYGEPYATLLRTELFVAPRRTQRHRRAQRGWATRALRVTTLLGNADAEKYRLIRAGWRSPLLEALSFWPTSS